jgi:hypothetical protein
VEAFYLHRWERRLSEGTVCSSNRMRNARSFDSVRVKTLGLDGVVSRH